MSAQVVLVDEYNNEVGVMPKLEAHERGVLHRAFSVFLFNTKNELLLQRRAVDKYHSGGLWTNTCCSHPSPSEAVDKAAHRRLMEEMGISADINLAFDFVYRAEFDNGLTEYEYDHVFIGEFNGIPKINPEEVSDWSYIEPDMLLKDISLNPHIYTEWFKIAVPKVMTYMGYEVDGAASL